jgi:hypothetical protein
MYYSPYPTLSQYPFVMPTLNHNTIPPPGSTLHSHNTCDQEQIDDDEVTVVTSNQTSTKIRWRTPIQDVFSNPKIRDQPETDNSSIPVRIMSYNLPFDGKANKVAQKWQRKLANRRLRKRPAVATNTCQSNLNIPKNHAIIDTGATGHFLLRGAKCKNLREDHDPLTVNMPEGATAKSSRECELDIPDLPPMACQGPR